MRKFLLLTYAMAILVGARAHAQNNRSAVSLTGFDTAACTVPDPCRTFGVAISKTNSGGEILVLSSGGYGQFTIDRSVSVICPVGLHAAIAPTSGEGITINALNTDQVVIRNLYLNGLGATTGIHFQNGAMLFLDSIVVDKFNGVGIWVEAANSYLSINNTVVRRTSNSGIYVPGYSGPIRGTINNSRVEKTSNYGIHIPGDSKVTITNTTASGNASSGFEVNASSPGSVPEASIESCVSSFNGGAGVEVLGGIARVSNSTITNNGYGFFQQAPGVVQSRGNNTVQGNGTDVSGTITPITGG
jgi:hypothetical protein